MAYTDEQIGTLEISGDPARFVTTEKVPIYGLTMDFDPVQDLHGYEYPWPAGGNVNKWKPLSGTTNGITFKPLENGEVNLSGTFNLASYTYIATTRLPIADMGITAGDTITIYSNVYGAVEYYADESSQRLSYSASTGRFTIAHVPDGTAYIRLLQYAANSPGVAGQTININARYLFGKGAITEWTPYENICPITGRDSVNVYVSPTPEIGDGTEIYEIDFDQTVYAGILTINEDGSGTIVSNLASVDLGTLNWAKGTTPGSNLFYAVMAFLEPLCKLDGIGLCSSYKYVRGKGVYGIVSGECCIDNTQAYPIFRLRDDTYIDSTTTEFKSAMSGVQLVYELNEPVTIQLDPIEITTLIGLNYVWTSENNLITLTFPYRKEIQPMSLTYDHCWTYPKAYIDRLEARVAALETAAAAAAAAAEAAAGDAKTAPETIEKEITEPVDETVTETKKGGK